MKISRQRLWLVFALCVLGAAATYLLVRRSTTDVDPSRHISHIQPEASEAATPKEKVDAEYDAATPTKSAEAFLRDDSEGEPVSDVAVMPEPDAPDDGLTLTPTPIMEDVEPYRARFQPAGRMELVHLPSLSQLVRQRPVGEVPHRLNLPVPDGRMLPVEVAQHERIALERGVFTGRIVDLPLSEVIVSYYEDAMTASMIVPGIGHFEIAYTGDDRFLLMEMDPDRLLHEAPPRLPSPPDENEGGAL